MKITKQYIYPPRPAKPAVPFKEAKVFARYGWLAQLKFPDKRCELSVDRDTTELWTRHDSKHAYQAPKFLLDEIAVLYGKILGLKKWSYIDGGLLDGKNANFSNIIAVWDILVRNGDWLLGTTYRERYDWLLARATDEPFMVRVGDEQIELGVKFTDHIFIPRLSGDFDSLWSAVEKANAAGGWSETSGGEPVLEGLVFKDPNGTLELACKEENNTCWSGRSRVCTKRHLF
jgi:hypothetical protein